MKALWFIAVETFGPTHPGWSNYLQFSGLNQLREIVGLDALLCPTVLEEIKEDDWGHIVNEDHLLSYYTDLPYLLERSQAIVDKQLLAVVLEPESEQRFRDVGDGEFGGYDLVERHTGVSALTNCQGFPESFANDELNEWGLLSDFVRAKQVQVDLRRNNPEEHHANTDLWAVWRLQSGA